MTRKLLRILFFLPVCSCQVQAVEKEWLPPVPEPTNEDLAEIRKVLAKRVDKVIFKNGYYYAFFDNTIREGRTEAEAIQNAVSLMLRKHTSQ